MESFEKTIIMMTRKKILLSWVAIYQERKEKFGDFPDEKKYFLELVQCLKVPKTIKELHQSENDIPSLFTESDFALI